ncbi:MAG: hypothetical protein M3Q07_26660 [Pseudobdellovibrionaceae bacterium]|nr:hypothetical protein [Pseudobdellovibrionaceae bacterium]
MSWAMVLMASQLSFPAGATLEQRQGLLKKYFAPQPGEMLHVTPRAIVVERRDPLLVKGELWINPPKGSCLTVRRDYEQRDRTYCKKTPITWDIFDLDASGRLHFSILLDGEPDPTLLSWPTPYRVANYVPLGAMESGENYNIPIHKCVASDDGTMRKIILHTMDNRRWFIFLPEFDFPLKVSEPLPNLNVKSDVKKEEKPAAPGEEKKPAKSVLAQLLSGDYKKAQKQGFIFRVNRRNAFEMSSSGFSETGSPQGMQGKCRYSFSGAPGDAGSGVIECYDTDTFDTIYTHVTCFSELKPKLKPVK